MKAVVVEEDKTNKLSLTESDVVCGSAGTILADATSAVLATLYN